MILYITIKHALWQKIHIFSGYYNRKYIHNTSSKMNTKMNVIMRLVTLLYRKTCVALLKESQKCTG